MQSDLLTELKWKVRIEWEVAPPVPPKEDNSERNKEWGRAIINMMINYVWIQDKGWMDRRISIRGDIWGRLRHIPESYVRSVALMVAKEYPSVMRRIDKDS